MANLSNINNKFLVTTGGNVLIGQTSAVGSSIFQVTGNSTFAGNVVVNGSQNALTINTTDSDGPYAVWKNTTNATLGFVGNANSLALAGNTNFGVRAQNDLIFASGGATERMRITSGARINIDVMPTVASEGVIRIGRYDANTSRYNEIQNSVTSTGAGSYMNLSVHSGTENVVTDVMTLLGSGNVGIGTDIPASKLSIKTNAITSNPEYLEFQDFGAGSSWAVGQDFGGLLWTTGDGTGIGPHSIAEIKAQNERNGAAAAGALVFSTAPYNTLMSERMRIDSFGNVGINENNPSAQIHNLQKTNNRAGGIYTQLNGNNYGLSMFVNSGGYGIIGSNGNYTTDVLTMDLNTGHVGIGSTSPDAKLDLSNSIETKKIQLYGIDNNYQFYGFGIEANTLVYSVFDSGDNHVFFAGTSSSTRNELMRIQGNGNVGIGNTSPSYKLQVEGDTYINGRDIGKAVNYASSQGWTAMTSLNSVQGYFGGDFTRNGATNENKIEWDYNYAGQRALIWRTQNNDSGSNDDGGWNKMMTVASNNMGYMSIVYVKRNSSSTNGSFYHGCWGSNTLYLTGTANTNPYFHSFNVSALPQDVWCISIGFIQANNDSNTANNPAGGVYRLDTGVKVHSGTSTFKMGTNATVQQQHRVYLYYSTNVNQNLSFSNPGFYALDGSQPSINNLLQG